MNRRNHRKFGWRTQWFLGAALLVQALWFCAVPQAAEHAAGDSALGVQPVVSKDAAPLAGYKLAWADEFDGNTLDTNKWTFRTDRKHLSAQRPENVLVSSGLLRLILKKETADGKQYTGAGIISRMAFRHGYYEARFKMPASAGWHTAFWLMKHDGSGTTDSQDALQGLDIVRNNSIDPHSYVLSVEKYNPLPTAVYGFETIQSLDLAAHFHVFGCEFTPQTAKFFLDGKLVQTVDATQFKHGDQNIWLSSIASHLGGTEAVDESSLPTEVDCDYIRFFQKAAETSTAK